MQAKHGMFVISISAREFGLNSDDAANLDNCEHRSQDRDCVTEYIHQSDHENTLKASQWNVVRLFDLLEFSEAISRSALF